MTNGASSIQGKFLSADRLNPNLLSICRIFQGLLSAIFMFTPMGHLLSLIRFSHTIFALPIA